jgi:hypothetical protein
VLVRLERRHERAGERFRDEEVLDREVGAVRPSHAERLPGVDDLDVLGVVPGQEVDAGGLSEN